MFVPKPCNAEDQTMDGLNLQRAILTDYRIKSQIFKRNSAQ